MRTLVTLAAAALVAASALGATACGSDDPADTGESSAQAEVPGGADPADVQVIDDWSRTLSEGDVEGAADYFAVPSIAQNVTPPLDLDSREDVVAFNRALSCGASLVEAADGDGFIVATFELTDRPGGDCGPGVGVEARTVFVIEDGRIAEWRRAADEPTVEPPAEGPVV